MTLATLFACANPTPQQASVPAAATAPESLRLALASTDLAVGGNRVVFGVIDTAEGPVRDASVQVSTFFLPPNGIQEGPIETVDAVFRAWPVTPRGVFTARLNFDRAGEWGIGAVITDAGGDERTATARVLVNDASATPALGTAAPRSISKTLADAGDFERLTTDFEPDADMYAMTIADALDTGKPLMVVFSTPAYCQTATCGPQLDVIKDVKAEYATTMNFIHVEVYDNPHEIEGDLTNAVISPTVEEWGLPSEPWTFVIDGDGVIRAKFEAFTTREELDEVLALVLN
ncbi:MAG: thioredoxin family protein [Chloroflexi bacterium]|nr:thioredoxin family protein [Chloroflexota bacterium]